MIFRSRLSLNIFIVDLYNVIFLLKKTHGNISTLCSSCHILPNILIFFFRFNYRFPLIIHSFLLLKCFIILSYKLFMLAFVTFLLNYHYFDNHSFFFMLEKKTEMYTAVWKCCFWFGNRSDKHMRPKRGGRVLFVHKNLRILCESERTRCSLYDRF